MSSFDAGEAALTSVAFTKEPMNKAAKIFNMQAQTYTRVRPGYPKAVYDAVAQCKTLVPSSAILEIGAGQGVATEEIAKYWHPHIDALEPGANLANILKSRMAGYHKIQVYESEFEEYQTDGKQYDAIFSATVFHWLDKALKYAKAYELLKPDGILVLYWNNYGLQDRGLQRKIDAVYRQYGCQRGGNKSAEEYTRAKIEALRHEIVESSLFTILRHEEMVHVLKYTAEQYIGLLRTFSDHTVEKIPNIEDMLSAIHGTIGDSIDVKIVVNVEIAGKDPF